MKTIAATLVLGGALIAGIAWNAPAIGRVGTDPAAQDDHRFMATAASDTMYQERFAPRTRGSDSAPVTVYELSDFQCPYCRSFAMDVFPVIDSLYIRTGRVRWVFLNFPARRMHPNAFRAAEFAMCAGDLDKFWDMHDELFESQPEWSKLDQPDPYFHTISEELDLDRGEIESCLESGVAGREIDADLVYPRRMRIGGVPTFVVDGKVLVQGARPVWIFVAALDSVLAARPRT